MTREKKRKETINELKELTTSKEMISKADKGNSIIITYQDQYHKNVMDFISNKNFTNPKSELIKKFQRDLRSNIKEFQLIIQKDEGWKYIDLNPTAPTIRGLIKIHKEDSPIRPIVNWKNAPAYKLVKMLVKKLQIHIPLPYTFPSHTNSPPMHIPLPYTFNVKNIIHLINYLFEIP
jgi:hypothetical protein